MYVCIYILWVCNGDVHLYVRVMHVLCAVGLYVYTVVCMYVCVMHVLCAVGLYVYTVVCMYVRVSWVCSMCTNISCTCIVYVIYMYLYI